MEEGYRARITQLIGEIDCPKSFRCVESEFSELCRAMDVGRETYLLCFETEPAACPFSIYFAKACYCRCPLRVYIAKNMKR